MDEPLDVQTDRSSNTKKIRALHRQIVIVKD
jgi:hypothetical protein